MRNENRAVFDRGPEPIDYALAPRPAPSRTAGETPRRPSSANIVARLLAGIVLRWRNHRNSMALLELSDDQLKDIGISRCEAYGGYTRYRRSESHALERLR